MFGAIQIRLMIGALIIALITGTWFYVRHLKSTIAELNTENITLKSSIERQNAAIENLKTEAEQRLKEYEIAIQTAKADTARAKSRATTIYKSVPSTPDDSCKSALDLVNTP